MSRALQFDPEPVWKLAGVCLLLLSFAVTGWLLGITAVALDGFLDSITATIGHGEDVFQHAHAPFGA